MADSILSSHPVWLRRQACGWSQAELASRAGISRAAISAIEGNRLSPSVASALQIAAALGCSVEELFGSGAPGVSPAATWAWPAPAGPCRYWEASVGARRLLFPVEATALNRTWHDGLCVEGVLHDHGPARPDATLVVATCDPAAGLLAAEYERTTGFRMLIFPRASRVALQLLREGAVHVAGIHFSTHLQPDRNARVAASELGSGCQLVRFADWETGVAVPSRARVRSTRALLQRPLRWATREPGSAARECFDELLDGRRFEGRQVDGHGSVAEAVRVGWAEAGVCVRFSASEAGLEFLPIRRDTVDLCIPGRFQHDRRVQALVGLLRSRSCRRWVSELPGYDARHMGTTVPLKAGSES